MTEQNLRKAKSGNPNVLRRSGLSLSLRSSLSLRRWARELIGQVEVMNVFACGDCHGESGFGVVFGRKALFGDRFGVGFNVEYVAFGSDGNFVPADNRSPFLPSVFEGVVPLVVGFSVGWASLLRLKTDDGVGEWFAVQGHFAGHRSKRHIGFVAATGRQHSDQNEVRDDHCEQAKPTIAICFSGRWRLRSLAGHVKEGLGHDMAVRVKRGGVDPRAGAGDRSADYGKFAGSPSALRESRRYSPKSISSLMK